MSKNNKLDVEIVECLMNVARCADYMCTTTKAIYDMVHRNQIPYLKLGKRLLFKKSEIDSALVKSSFLEK